MSQQNDTPDADPEQRESQMFYDIVGEIGRAADRLGAPSFLLGAILSWRDTMDDESTLEHLRMWNAGELPDIICATPEWEADNLRFFDGESAMPPDGEEC